MVYDPVRDCDVPSPAITRRPQLWDNPTPPPPPAFADHQPMPARPVSAVGGGGSLRSLLNDDGDHTSRRGSDMTTSSYDDEYNNRPHLSKLLNSETAPLARTSSASSSTRDVRETSSPRNPSPSVGLHPASAGSVGRASRSPMIHQGLSSPAAMGYPYDVHTTPTGYGGSSRRSSMDTSRPMPPPSEPVRHHDMYNTPMAQSTPLRSPSVSVSPRTQHINLPNPPRPGPSSRPASSRSASGSYGVSQSAVVSSPEPAGRRRSDDASIASPGPMARPWDPAQPSGTRHWDRPLPADEIARLRAMAPNFNLLRRKGKAAPPQWSAPSPRNSLDQHEDPMPTGSGGPSRRGSTASAAADRRGRREDSTGLKRPSHEIEDGRNQRRRMDSYTGKAAEVASHYNSRPEVGVEHREFSPIIGLKKFNNWVKSVLIGKFAYRNRNGPGAKVLDIGCGKGGDLNKWKQARIALYVGMDIAATSIDQARERYNTMRGNRFDGYFFAHDCYSKPISDILPDQLQHELYNNVTMQFCMHYAFETAAKARMMIENVSRYLRRGGVFIGTIPNSSLLLERLDEIPEGEELRYGNSCYAIEFNERRHKGIYGHEYRFYLEDAVEDVPEYIVDWDNFVSLAAEYGLEVVYRKTFNDVLQEEQGSRDFGPLLGKMGVINEHGESAMDSDQWEAANLYMAFAFEKVR